MKDNAELITDYEHYRVLVRDLTKQKGELLEKCAVRVESNFRTEICLKGAWDEMNELTTESYYGGAEDYYGVLTNGDYCDKCIEAYELKIGPIAEAKAKFGAAKRSLSARGKKLLTQEAPNA